MTVFLDTEDTGLNVDLAVDASEDEIWEVAAVRVNKDGSRWSLHAFVEHDVEKAMRLPEPFRSDYLARYDPAHAVSRVEATRALQDIFQKEDGVRQQLIGAVPDYDTAALRRLMGIKRTESPWHYHITDIETMMVGFLAGLGVEVGWPYNSDRLSELIGVDPTQFSRHTAMGDVEWTMANHAAMKGI